MQVLSLLYALFEFPCKHVWPCQFDAVKQIANRHEEASYSLVLRLQARRRESEPRDLITATAALPVYKGRKNTGEV